MITQGHKTVKSIQFGLFSPEEIKRGSVVQVLHPETVENSIPKENGLIDLRMGTTERSFLCQTCNGSSFECIGHYGHIELSKPMFHVGFIGKIKKVLECVCFYCSRIKIPKEKLPMGLENCWSVLKTRSLCEGDSPCGNKQPLIKREGLTLIGYMKDDEEGKVVLNGEKVHSILKKIVEEDYVFLGFDKYNCKPEWMVLSVIIVPPPTVRPSIVLNGHLRGEDDLTHKLSDIVKANTFLKKYEQEGAPGHIIRDYEQLLQFHIATLIDNEIGGQPQALQKNGRPLKSLSARLKGKEGRIRGNLMGKRVDFSARSVISPDPNLSIEEVGVPESIAKIHTFPETVNSFNIKYLQELVQRGPNEHPGANYVIRTDGQRIDLNFNRQDLKLEKGFVVERHMVDDDEVLFNRQPSLHKMSMMGHRVRIMPGKSFRLNLSATSPYNADFDGDEMNLHMPQSYSCKAELSLITAVDRQIVSPQSNKPVIGIVQDALVGSYLFTQRDTFFTREEAMGLLYNIKTFPKGEDFLDYMVPTILTPTPLFTGKQIFSAILPVLFYSKKEEKENFLDKFVLIRKGILLAGAIDVDLIGTRMLGLIHIIYNDYGSVEAKNFLDNIQKLVNYFLLHISSFSVGIGDCVASASLAMEARSAIQNAKMEVDEIISITKRNELEKLPGMTLLDTLESKINATLNKARNVPMDFKNNIMSMIISGSKGSFINISQILTCMGQQNVEGTRIPFGFNERSLPHFYKYDYSAISRGFVENSYLTGMRPHEFFFHAMGGREGIIDTSIKTAETGYIQRRLVKALEDAIAQHDYSVRNMNGNIYQFVYGDDSFDAQCLENVRVNLDSFKEQFCIDNFGNEVYAIKSHEVSKEVYALLRNDMELQKKLDDEYQYLLDNRNLMDNFYCTPVNIPRILSNFPSSTTDSISPYVILDLLDSLMTDNHRLNYYIRASLNVKRVLLSLTFKDLKSVISQIENKIFKARINANENVGTLAAQCVGEPATQMTLNTFHLAGVSSTHTMGVPRLNEIINLSKSIKTPFMKIYFIESIASSIDLVRIQQNKLEFLNFKMLVQEAQLIYDPEITNTVVNEDSKIVSDYFDMPDELDFSCYGKLLLRFTINRSLLISKGLSLDYICRLIKDVYPSCFIISSDENDDFLVIRVRFANQETISYYSEAQLKILKLHLQGLPEIRKAHIASSAECGYYLITDGIGLPRILSEPDIENNKVVCNDIIAIYNTLGIEAARQSILNELNAVLEGTSYVNIRHCALLADVMCNKGFLAGITRHGVSRESTSALKRASFEETVDVLLEAAANSELDKVMGISENVMLGQVAPVGTGNVEIILDTKKIDCYFPAANSPAVSHYDESGFSPISLDFVGNFSPDLGSSRSISYNPSLISYPLGSNNFSPSSVYVSPSSNSYAPFVGGDYSPLSHLSMSNSYGSTSHTPTSNSYSPTSNSYSPTSNSHAAGSGAYSPGASYNASYTPVNAEYSPMSTLNRSILNNPQYSPANAPYSPNSTYNAPYSPSNAHYSPMTGHSRPNSGGANYSPMMQHYSPMSVHSRPNSGSYVPGATPGYNPYLPQNTPGPASGSYSPQASSYSPLTSAYQPYSGASTTNGGFNPKAPSISPSSPKYEDTFDKKRNSKEDNK